VLLSASHTAAGTDLLSSAGKCRRTCTRAALGRLVSLACLSVGLSRLHSLSLSLPSLTLSHALSFCSLTVLVLLALRHSRWTRPCPLLCRRPARSRALTFSAGTPSALSLSGCSALSLTLSVRVPLGGTGTREPRPAGLSAQRPPGPAPQLRPRPRRQAAPARPPPPARRAIAAVYSTVPAALRRCARRSAQARRAAPLRALRARPSARAASRRLRCFTSPLRPTPACHTLCPLLRPPGSPPPLRSAARVRATRRRRPRPPQRHRAFRLPALRAALHAHAH